MHSSLSHLRNSRALEKDSIESDFKFQAQVRNCISSLDKMPKLKEKVIEKLTVMDRDYHE